MVQTAARAASLLPCSAAEQVPWNPLELMSQAVVQEWCTTQLDLARQQAPGPQSVRCLLPRSPSLEQAGGLHRMVLRGHTGGIMKVLLTSGGIDVITGELPVGGHWCELTSGGIDVITGEWAEAQQRPCTREGCLAGRAVALEVLM